MRYNPLKKKKLCRVLYFYVKGHETKIFENCCFKVASHSCKFALRLLVFHTTLRAPRVRG